MNHSYGQYTSLTLLTTLIHNDLPKIPPDPLACQVNVHFNTEPQRGLLELAPDLKLFVIHRYISPANTVNKSPHRYAI